MNDRRARTADEVERYLRTGETDPHTRHGRETAS